MDFRGFWASYEELIRRVRSNKLSPDDFAGTNVTLTNPGAESGLFLKRVEELLLGGDGFYDDIFKSLGVPYEAVKWRRDVNPIDREQTMLEKQMAVATLVRGYRVRGHLIADLDPLRWKEPRMHPELDPATYGLTIWDLDREFLTGGLAGQDKMVLSE